MDKPNAITIQGIVIAAAWKPGGEIMAVDIAGFDEKRYRIANDDMGSQLRVLIKKRIVADGFIEMKNNQSVLHVRHFQIDTANPLMTS